MCEGSPRPGGPTAAPSPPLPVPGPNAAQHLFSPQRPSGRLRASRGPPCSASTRHLKGGLRLPGAPHSARGLAGRRDGPVDPASMSRSLCSPNAGPSAPRTLVPSAPRTGGPGGLGFTESPVPREGRAEPRSHIHVTLGTRGPKHRVASSVNTSVRHQTEQRDGRTDAPEPLQTPTTLNTEKRKHARLPEVLATPILSGKSG